VTSLLRRIAGAPGEQRFTFNDLLQQMQFGGLTYPFIQGGTPSGDGESVEPNFEGYVNAAYKNNGVIFACMTARACCSARRASSSGRCGSAGPGTCSARRASVCSRTPWPGATTGDLLTRIINDADISGNSYTVRRGGELRRLRPDWVTIVTGSRSGSEIDAEVVGYLYKPGGPSSGENPVSLLPEQVAHFAPLPDPVARFRGMSWLSPILEEILADMSATTHKKSFFDNGAKLGYVVTLGENVKNPDQFDRWVAKFRVGHEGEWNAYKTLFLASGADVKTVGADMKQVDFASVQGHGETRICAAARVPPIIVGLSEGLDSATYSNYGQARRAFADLTMRPLWRNVAGSLARIVDVPAGADLWYDDRDIPFLQEDQQDAAAIQQTQAITIRELINAGYEPDTVVRAVHGAGSTACSSTRAL
jgi:phage portal protein BeeE